MMTYKMLKLNVDEQIYSQVVNFLKLLPANQCIIDEPETQLTLQQSSFKKLARLKNRDCIVGDPEDLVHIESRSSKIVISECNSFSYYLVL
jgi:hypothetical protein